ncbi:Basic FGF-repressed Zic-binding protein, putative [Pediculus humanus corporis]|uniref:Basic FGF-repressed Zic-binding protein, putative n=1 Tax=Pediculus humanus subsp. corporis TaxID=121224 RepID=E0VP02_PEDHC|nr:Basic FGF-repressed Zic-binding protein, putative [Pediculus humanus corporis]EEB15108.1 Basic FGF-repressed Zic-binding protein, putative [Pediculus humanus corporis]
MPDTFYSWFKVTELHVWMLLVRLHQDGPESKKIRQSLINAMWEDALKRSKTLAPGNKNNREDFKFLLNSFSTILFAYDEGLLTNDKVFSNALWYYFFGEKCDDPRKIEALIRYIRSQIAHLNEIQTKNIKDENITTKIWNSVTLKT